AWSASTRSRTRARTRVSPSRCSTTGETASSSPACTAAAIPASSPSRSRAASPATRCRTRRRRPSTLPSRAPATPADLRPMDPGQRRLAERRLVHALQRLHRREPMAADFRVDALVDAARAVPRATAGHRGSVELTLTDAQLRDVVDALVAAGQLARRSHRVWLRGHRPQLDGEMQARVDRLLDGLREAGAAPPRVEGIAARLGIPPPLL